MEGIPEVVGNSLTTTSVRDMVKMMTSMTNSRTEAKRVTRGGDWCVFGYEHQATINPPVEALIE